MSCEEGHALIDEGKAVIHSLRKIASHTRPRKPQSVPAADGPKSTVGLFLDHVLVLSTIPGLPAAKSRQIFTGDVILR